MAEEIVLEREKVFQEVWAEPMQKVARRYAISDVALAKACRKLNIPVPWRGYWAQKAAGQKLKQPKLSAAKEGQPTTHRISPRTILDEPRVPRPELSEQAQQLIERERLPEYRIRVADELVDPHPLVVVSAPGLRKPEKKAPRRVPEKTLLIHVGAEAVERALRIMDALLKALEFRHFKPEIFPFPPPGEPLRGPAGTGAWVLEQFVEIRLDEDQEWFDPRKEPGYTEKTGGKDSLVRITLPRSAFYRSTGKLALGLNYLPKHGERRTWSDGRSQKLEDCLNEFIKGMIITADRMRQEHEAEERERRAQAEAARARIEQQRRKELEERLRSGFRKRLDTWLLAKSARDFIQALEGHRAADMESNADLRDWLAWARHYTTRLEETSFDVLADIKPPPPPPAPTWPAPRPGQSRPSY